MNVKNLKQLADYFSKLEKNNFDFKKVMYVGFENDYYYFRDFITKNNIKIQDIEIDKHTGSIVFIIWVQNFTGLKYIEDSKAYEWLFSYCWAGFNRKSVDPTPQGVSKRIEFLIKYGVPKNFEKQYKGEEIYICSE